MYSTPHQSLIPLITLQKDPFLSWDRGVVIGNRKLLTYLGAEKGTIKKNMLQLYVCATLSFIPAAPSVG